VGKIQGERGERSLEVVTDSVGLILLPFKRMIPTVKKLARTLGGQEEPRLNANAVGPAKGEVHKKIL